MKAALPDMSGMNAAMLAVGAVMLVAGSAMPVLRSFREAQRAANTIVTAGKDAIAKSERVQSSQARAETSIAAVSGLDPDTAVLKLKRARDDVQRYVDDVELAVLAIETLRERVLAFHKYRSVVVQTVPDFDARIEHGLATLGVIDKTRTALEEFHERKHLEEFDRAIGTAVDAVASVAVQHALAAVSTAKSRPSADEAMRSLDDIGAFLREHGLKPA